MGIVLPMTTQTQNFIPATYPAVRVSAHRRREVRHCDVCGMPAEFNHSQLVHAPTRRLIRACESCTKALTSWHDGQYRAVPKCVEILPEFHMGEGQWASLQFPINLAFLYYSTPDRRVVAMYPGPSGAAAGKLPIGFWEQIAAENPILRQLRPDVEGLLMNRAGRTQRFFRVPIDECFNLFQYMRDNWNGVTGGIDLWRKVEWCFARWTTPITGPQAQSA
jgi:hypothetical protein